MKIALAQLAIQQGNIRKNFDSIIQMIDKAVHAKAELIVFPEMALLGNREDSSQDQGLQSELDSCHQRIQEYAKDIIIVYGDLARDMEHSAVYAVYEGVTSQFYQQSNISKTVPMMLGNDDMRMGFVMYDESNVNCDLRGDGLDILIVLGNTRWYSGIEQKRQEAMQKLAAQCQCAVVYVNCAGIQNTGKNVFLYDGQSMAVNSEGTLLGACGDVFEEELRIIDTESAEPEVQTENKLYKALVTALQAFDKQMFNQSVKWIIGLSGGLDSSISAALLCRALGSDRVIGYNMASCYNSEATRSNAASLAKRLGMEIREGSIEKVVQATADTMNDYGYAKVEGLAYENIQARQRGHLLSTFASLENGVVINNGNKIETALGYCTLYGDAVGALGILADCTKVQLFELAQCINEDYQAEIIPMNLVPKVENGQVTWLTPPSAELKDQQLDPMKWFYHDWLIQQLVEEQIPATDILERYASGALMQEDIGFWLRYYGLDQSSAFIDDLEWILKTINKAVFKRIQSPPIVTISKRAFGEFKEIQTPYYETDQFRELKEKLLKQSGGK